MISLLPNPATDASVDNQYDKLQSKEKHNHNTTTKFFALLSLTQKTTREPQQSEQKKRIAENQWNYACLYVYISIYLLLVQRFLDDRSISLPSNSFGAIYFGIWQKPESVFVVCFIWLFLFFIFFPSSLRYSL